MLRCTDGERKISNQKRRTFYSRERFYLDFLQKRRKLLKASCIMTSGGVLSGESDSSSHCNGMNGGAHQFLSCSSFEACFYV